MDDKILYCYKLNGTNITQTEIKNYREVVLKNSKRIESECIIYFKNNGKQKCVVEKAFLNTVKNQAIHSFDPSIERAAMTYIEHYRKKRKTILQELKFLERVENTLFDVYLK